MRSFRRAPRASSNETEPWGRRPWSQAAGKARVAVAVAGRGRVGLLLRRQPQAGGGHYVAAGVARGSHPEHGRRGGQALSPQLGAGQVHAHPAGLAQLLLGVPQVGNHPAPGRRVVVGTVDAQAVHAFAQQLAHQLVVGGGLTGHSHHNAAAMVCRGRTQAGVAVLGQQAGATLEVGRGLRGRVWFGGVGCQQGLHHGPHRFDGGQGVGLGPAQRRKAQRGKPPLQLAPVVLAQGQVVQQVAGAAPEVRMHGLQLVGGLLGQGQHIGAQGSQLGQQPG